MLLIAPPRPIYAPVDPFFAAQKPTPGVHQSLIAVGRLAQVGSRFPVSLYWSEYDLAIANKVIELNRPSRDSSALLPPNVVGCANALATTAKLARVNEGA